MKQLVDRISHFFPSSNASLNSAFIAKKVESREGKTPKSYLIYTQHITALAAKIAQIDGPTNKAEYESFATLFAFEYLDPHLLRRLFIKHTHEDNTHYTQHIRSLILLPLTASARQELMQRLTLLAACDGPLHPLEIDALHYCTLTLGLEENDWKKLVHAQLYMGKKHNPYHMLGVTKRTDIQTIKNHYHQRIKAIHPDQLQRLSLSVATQALLKEYFYEFTLAYQHLVKSRATTDQKQRRKQ